MHTAAGARGLPRALIINPVPKFGKEMAMALRSKFAIELFTSATDAIESLRRTPAPVLIMIGYSLLKTDAARFLGQRQENPELVKIPVVVTGSVDPGEFVSNFTIHGPHTYLKRPFLKSRLKDECARLVDGPLEKNWENLPERQAKALTGTVKSFRGLAQSIEAGEPLDIADAKDSCLPLVEEICGGNALQLLENVKGHHNYTFVHSLRVSTFLSMAGFAIGIKGPELLTLTAGGMLHDVGKIATPQEILNSPKKLDDNEWLEMKKHVSHTHEILAGTDGVSEGIRIIAEQHHEKLDGSGYPHGLTAKDLSELARLSTIADIFSALTDERSYKPAFSFDKSFAIMDSMEGHLDTRLLAIFKEILYANQEKIVADAKKLVS